jgi:hypothetical protein
VPSQCTSENEKQTGDAAREIDESRNAGRARNENQNLAEKTNRGSHGFVPFE